MIYRYIVVNIGCIECGVSSNIVKTYPTEEEAEAAAYKLDKELDWREGGQNRFEVFDLQAPMALEYRKVLE